MSKLYIAMCVDRHTDPILRIFDTPDGAIGYAKKFALEHCRDKENLEEEEIEGWIYYCQISEEGEYVRVEELILNNE